MQQDSELQRDTSLNELCWSCIGSRSRETHLTSAGTRHYFGWDLLRQDPNTETIANLVFQISLPWTGRSYRVWQQLSQPDRPKSLVGDDKWIRLEAHFVILACWCVCLEILFSCRLFAADFCSLISAFNSSPGNKCISFLWVLAQWLALQISQALFVSYLFSNTLLYQMKSSCTSQWLICNWNSPHYGSPLCSSLVSSDL